jgi:uncharacterized surface anchored protein
MNKKNNIPRSDIKKRVTSALLAGTMAVTSMFSGLSFSLTTPQTAEAASSLTVSGKEVVNEAMKYLGYGYSQEGNRHGADGTFDCSGLVNTVLTGLGFTNVPDSTSAWNTAISNQSLSLGVDIEYASSLANALNSTSSKWKITSSTVDSSALGSADLPAGTIIVTKEYNGSAAHMSIVVGTLDKTYSTSTDATFWNSYYQFLSDSTALFKEYSNYPGSGRTPKMVIANQESYNIYGSPISAYTTELFDTVMNSSVFSAKQSYFLIMNVSANAGTHDLGSKTWVIDAASTQVGVRLANKIGGKGTAVVPAYVIVPPTEIEDTKYTVTKSFGTNTSGSASSNGTVTSVEFTLQDSSGNKITTDAYGNSIVNPKEAKYSNSWKVSWDKLDSSKTYKAVETKVVYKDSSGTTHTLSNSTDIAKYFSTSTSRASDGLSQTTTNTFNTLYGQFGVKKTDKVGNKVAATFNVYSDPSCSNKIGDFTTTGGEGTYTLSSWSAKAGLTKTVYFKEANLDSNGYVTIDGTKYKGDTNTYRAVVTGASTASASSADIYVGTSGTTKLTDNTVVNEEVVSHTFEKQFANGADSYVTSIQIQLYRKVGSGTGTAVGSAVTLTSTDGNNWKYTWENLPKYDSSKNQYKYYVGEIKVNGSAAALKGFTVTTTNDGTSIKSSTTITNSLNTTSHSFVKKFGSNNTEGYVNSITVQLYQNGSAYGDAVTLTKGDGNNWKYSWSSLRKYDDNGNEYKYHVAEIKINGSADALKAFTVTTTNDGTSVVNKTEITNTIDTVSHTVNKVFGTDTESYVNSITVQLKQNGSNYGDAVTINKASNGTISYTWSNLPKKNPTTGAAYTYTVTETAVNGSTDLLSKFTVVNSDTVSTITSITNTTVKTSHTFYKKFGNTDSLSAVTSIEVQLYRKTTGGTAEAVGNAVTITKSSKVDNTAWAYKWTGLLKYDVAGNEYHYYAVETKVGYSIGGQTGTLTGAAEIRNYFTTSTDNDGSTVMTSTTFTNTLIPLYGKVTVEKVNSENETVKIAGVKYGVYSDEACTKQIGDYLTTDDTGIAVYEVAGPWYKLASTTKTVYIKEHSTVSPYILDNTVYTVVITGSTKDADSSSCAVTADGTNVGTSIKQFKQDNDEQYGQITVTKYGEALEAFSGTTLTGSNGVITGYTNGSFTYKDSVMSGATFELYPVGTIKNQAGTIVYDEDTYMDGNPIMTLTTGTDGTGVFTGLPLGTYRIVETGAPAGQTIPEVHEWNVTLFYAGQTVSVASTSQTVNDALTHAKVYVVKIDDTTKQGLEGAYFGLYTSKDLKNANGTVIAAADSLICVVKTDAAGKGTFTNAAGEDIDIPYGSYYVKEIQTRDGYVLTDEVYEFTFGFDSETTYEKTFTHTFTDTRMSATISIQKYDEKTGEAVAEGDGSLSGAVYGLYAREDIVHPDGYTGIVYKAGEMVAELTTDENGKASINDLYLGKYYVKELTPSKGYLLDDGEYDLVVVSDGVNHVETTITAYKNTEVITDDTETPEYPIERGFALVKFTEDLSTSTEIDGVTGAGFTVYLKSTLIYTEDGSIDYTNSPKTVIGKNGETENFTGNVYAVVNADGTYTTVSDPETPGAELLMAGYMETIDIPYGEYLVHESTVPSDKFAVDDFTVVIGNEDTNTQNGNPVSNKEIVKTFRYFNDAPFEAKIKVIKRDKTTGKDIALSGTTFKIFDITNECYVEQYYLDDNSQKHVISEWTTNDEGFLITKNALPAGTYRIEEQLAPDGYYNSELAEGIQSQFTITIGTSFVFEDGTVDVYYDEDLKCYILPVVYYNDEVRGEIEVYKSGEAVSYWDEETKDFVWDEIPLSGAVYTVYAAEDIYTPDHQLDENGNRTTFYKAGDVVTTITTGADGYGRATDLPLGNYKIVETTAPYGYLLGDSTATTQYATLAYDNQTVKLVYDSDGVANTFYNDRPSADVSVVKYERDKETGAIITEMKLPGAVFNLIAATDITNYKGEVIMTAGSVIETVTTGEDGVAKFKKDIPYGVYNIIETKAPAGYMLDATPEQITFAYADQYTPVIEVKAEHANYAIDVELSKTDITTGGEIAGAVLQVIAVAEDGSESLYASWTSGDDGFNEDGSVKTHILHAVPVGNYILRETSAPTAHGYVKSEDVAFTVEEVIDIQKVDMTDDHTELHIKKTDFVTGDEVEGAHLQLIDSDGNIYAEWVTDGSEYVLEYIPVGTYTLVETLPADGYATAEAVTIEVKEVGHLIEVQKAEMKDQPLTIKIKKTDFVYGKEVIGATLQLIDGNGDVFVQWVTGDTTNSNIEIDEETGETYLLISYIPAGIYTLREIQAPDGYEIAEDVTVVVADTGSIQTTEMMDYRTPEAKTTATDKATGSHTVSYGETVTLKDTVNYKYLIPGKTYTVTGTVMVKETGKALTDKDGNAITATTTFIPESKVDGSVGLEFTIDSTLIPNTSLVIFEEVKENGQTVIIHADLEDEDQTVYVPEIGTTFTDRTTEEHVAAYGKQVTMTDTVAYKNLVVGDTYTVTGVIYSKETGKPITDADGNEITASKTFVAEVSEGTVEIEFTIDTTVLAGQTLVAFESVSTGGVEVAIHADINDEGQSVTVPDIGTTATDKATGGHRTDIGKAVTIVDEVAYTNLIPGKEYVVSGTLMLKSTGKPFTDAAGNPYTATKTFTADQPDGIVTLEFVIDTTLIAGESIVAFETVSYKGVEVAVEANLDDADQTVEVPKVGKIAVFKKGQAIIGTESVETKYGVVDKLLFGYVYLKDVEFTVYKDITCKEAVTTIVTNGDGLAVSEDLVEGTYYIVETKTPAGYAKDDTVYEVVIDGISDNTYDVEYVLDVTKEIVNHLCSSTINIYKVGTDLNGEVTIPLEGVYFGVFADEDLKNIEGDVVIKKDDCVAIIKTNSEGIASITESLPAGSYYYKEIKTLDEYVLDDTEYHFTVSLENDNVVIDVNKTSPLLNHAKYGTLTIHKVDQDGNALGAGVEFLLKNVDTGDTWTLVTDENGEITISNLPIGYIKEGQWVYYTYELQETKGLDNYKMDDTVYRFCFTADDTAADAVFKSYTVKNVILGIKDYSAAGGITMLLMAIAMFIAAYRRRREEIFA